MFVIDLKEWDVSYDELVRWSLEKEVELFSINNYHGGYGPKTTYAFSQEEDYLAFTLTFQKDENMP